MSAQSDIDETSRQGSAAAWTFSFWGVVSIETHLWGCAHCLEVLLRSANSHQSSTADPIEHLHAMSATPEAALPTTSITTLVEKYVGGLFRALGVHSFFFSPTHRPTLIIEWLSIVAAITLWRRGEKRSAMQITLLLLSAFAVDASFTLRGGQAGGLRTLKYS